MQKILITYATHVGSTAEVAAFIADVLRAAGESVEVQSLTTVREVTGSDAIMVGSAIRISHWLPEVVQFVRAHRERLRQMPTASFLVSGLLGEETPEMRQQVLAFLDPVRVILEPVSIGLFAGRIDYRTLSWRDRTIAKLVGAPEGDWRDWDAIGHWARDLPLHLALAQA